MKILSPPQLINDPSHLFRPEDVVEKTGWAFRTYAEDSKEERGKMVYNTYLDMHTNQTVEFVQKKKAEWCKFDKFRMGLLEALDLLNSFVDDSDPDIAIPNSIHGYQTAERIREIHPDKDWMQLVGLIHDLGKVMALYDEPQWAVVGDTFPVGCAVAPSVVLASSTFANNPDVKNPKFNTTLGMYTANCGLNEVLMSWGHDEYLYQVLRNHPTCSLPEEGMYMIRFHSFYPWHTGGDYNHICSQNDLDMLPWVKEFNKFDLYTKKDTLPDVDVLKPYYQKLVDKYCPGNVAF